MKDEEVKLTLMDLRRNWGVAAVFAAFVALVMYPVYRQALQPAIVGAMTGMGMAVWRGSNMAALRQRVDAERPPAWDVELNGVKIGTVSDATYAAIRLRHFGGWRLCGAQLLNWGVVLSRMVGAMLVAVPLLAFWSTAGIAVLTPAYFMGALRQLQAATPESISVLATWAFLLLFQAVFIAVTISACLMSGRYGFVNRFAAASMMDLRRLLGVAAGGDLVLVRWVNGVRRVDDGRAVLRGSGRR